MTDAKGNLHTSTRIGRSPFSSENSRVSQHISELIHFISHEIDNPVTAIVSLSSVLPRAGADEERISHFSELIAQEAWKISRLSEKLTYLLTQRPASKVPCNLPSLIDRVSQKLSQEKFFAQWNITLAIAAKATDVLFEFHQLSILIRESVYAARMLAEILQNDDKQIQIIADSDGGEVILSARIVTKKQFQGDLGILFDCSAEENSSNNSHSKELSLSLAVASSIAKHFNCEFEVEEESTENGTIYHITSYLKKAQVSKTLPTTTSGNHEAVNGPTIIIIDDEPVVASGLKKILELSFRGAQVKIYTPEEAIDHLKAKEPCLAVLCDLHLPGHSGLKLRTQLLALAPELSNRLVMMTGDRGHAELEALGSLLLYKPFDAETLVLKVREILEG